MAPMRLAITEYDTPRGPWHTKVIQNTTWEAIESSITQLDRCLFPFIQLYCDLEAQDHDLPQFEVIGGDGAYSVVCRTSEGEFWLQNPLRGADEIDVWISDQGTTMPARSVCSSLPEVLVAAHHFYTHGAAYPKSRWANHP